MGTTESFPIGPGTFWNGLTSINIHRSASTAALTLVLVALWCLTHRYLGIDGDAKLYAFQAMARIHPALKQDLFLQNVSQDQFTIFSPIYAWCIECLGLHYAAIALTILAKVWFMAAAWFLARALSNSRIAFLAVAALIILPASYGAFHVFQYSEDWLTARSPAEAMVVTALALHFSDFKRSAILIAAGAMLIHPLMGLPGLLALGCLHLTPRSALQTAAAGLTLTLLIALTAELLPSSPHLLAIMDEQWLEVARQRTPFLFPQLWRAEDWKWTARPLLSLTIGVLALDDPRLRKLCWVAMLVGATGLVVALIASFVGPVAVLNQGQAWRWLWITSFAAVLAVIPTVRALWQDDRCGPLCAGLLVCGWMFTAIDGPLTTALALLLWLARPLIHTNSARFLRWSVVPLGLIVTAWMVASCSGAPGAARLASGEGPFAVTAIRNVMGLDFVPMLFAGLLILWIRGGTSRTLPVALCVGLVASLAMIVPVTFRDRQMIGPMIGSPEFSAWRFEIPPESNVLVVPTPDSAAFAWFLLDRPSYLSADQSAGTIFSRQTEIEIRRRAAVVSSLWESDWQLDWRTQPSRGGSTGSIAGPRPLTIPALISVCRDPKLNFVVAKEYIGFGAVQDRKPGPWRGWSLYNCRRVNSAGRLS